MKFDGYASDGKRILFRGCGDVDTNICNATDSDWHGATGTTCICNAEDCNHASITTTALPPAAIVTALVSFTALMHSQLLN